MNDQPLEVRDLLVRIDGRTILDIPHLIVSQGEILAIIGPNGAGKSVLLSTLALLITPASGTIKVDGEEVTRQVNLVALRRRMAVVFQDPLLLNMSVQENVEMGLRFRGVPRNKRRPMSEVWLERFGIRHLADRQARTLSGGEAQRTSLARAFVLEPRILYLDEPFSALDMPTHDALIHDLRLVLKETGTTTVFVTHNRDEALAMAHRVGVIMGGRLLQIGTPNDVFASPVSREVADFVGMENILPGEVVGGKDGLARVKVQGAVAEAVSEAPLNQKVLFCLRPEEVTLFAAGTELPRTSARNRFNCQVVSLTSFGGLMRVSLDCGFPLVALVTRMSAEELGLRGGVMVQASFKASAVHLIPRS